MLGLYLYWNYVVFAFPASVRSLVKLWIHLDKAVTGSIRDIWIGNYQDYILTGNIWIIEGHKSSGYGFIGIRSGWGLFGLHPIYSFIFYPDPGSTRETLKSSESDPRLDQV